MRLASQLAISSSAFLLFTAPVAAQAYLFLGGGVTIPTGEYGDFAKTGWTASTGLTFDVGDKGVWVGVEGLFGSNTHEGTSGDKTNVYGATGLLGYSVQSAGSVHPYVYGGAGFLAHQYKPGTSTVTGDTETKFNWAGAGGLSFVLSPKVSLWTEGRYNGAKGTQHLALQAGLNILLGRRN